MGSRRLLCMCLSADRGGPPDALGKMALQMAWGTLFSIAVRGARAVCKHLSASHGLTRWPRHSWQAMWRKQQGCAASPTG